MPVYKDPRSPFWRYEFQLRNTRFYGPTGKRTKRQAEQVEAEERRKAERAMSRPDGPVEVTLDKAAGELWANVAKHQSSAKTQKNEIANVVRIVGPTMLISEIRDPEVARFVATRRGEADSRFKPENHPKGFTAPLVSPATVNRETKMLSRIIKRAAKVLRAKQPPEPDRPDWTFHTLQEADPPDRPLTRDQEQRLFAELVAHAIPIVDTVLLTGLRLKEVMTLDCANIDLQGRQGRVRRKSRKHGGEWFTFDITEPLLAVLAPHVDGRAEGPVWRYGPHCDCHVCHKKKNHGRRIKDISTGFDAACARAGIPDFRFHDLRHTYGTRALRLTGNLKLAQRGLGHKSITSTLRYAHHAPSELPDLQRKLAAARPAKPTTAQKSPKNPRMGDAQSETVNDIKKKAQGS